MLIDNERAPQWEPCYFPTGFLELSPVLWPLGNTSTSKTVVILHSLWHIFHGDQFAATAKLLQSCPTLCDPIDGSPPGSPIPGILQTRTLEWIAISFSTVTGTQHHKEIAQESKLTTTSLSTLVSSADFFFNGQNFSMKKQYIEEHSGTNSTSNHQAVTNSSQSGII